jgi:hypothetical protein
MKVHYQIALAWLLPTIGLSAATFIQNPSFESNYNETFPHYGAIDSWIGGSGVNESGGPFHNGATPIPDRSRVGFQQGSGSLGQEITGLTPGRQYWVQFWYDARNCCGGTIDIITKFEADQLDRIGNVRPAMLNSRPYQSRSVAFTPNAESGVLAFNTIAAGDATANFDAVTIVERDTNNVVLFNPSFEASGIIPAAGELTSLPGWEISGIIGVDDGSAGHANNGAIPEQDLVAFIQGAGSITQSVANLVVGKTYQVSLAYNAKTGTTPHLRVQAGANVLFEEDVAPVGGANPYKTRNASFVASDITAALSIAQTKEGTDVLLIDNVRVVGETTKPLPPLQISPSTAELAPGEKTTVSITVPTELLAIKGATLTFRSPNTNVIRLANTDGDGIVGLNFVKDGTNRQTIELEAVARGSTRLEIVDAAGLTVENDVAASVVTSFVRNSSFESSVAPGGVGYGSILAWTTPPGGVGINKAAGPFHDNGAIPDREQVAFVQGSGTISQEISGLTPGKKYALQFFHNVRNCCGGTMSLAVRFDGTTLTNLTEITPVGEQNSYHYLELELSPAKSSGLLEFTSTAVGDASLLLDAVNIVQRDPGAIAIINPSFEASGSPANVGYVQPNLIAGWEVTGGGRGININGAGPFTDNGLSSDQDRVLLMQGITSASQALAGFQPNQEYTLMFDVNGRMCCGPEPTAYRVTFADAILVEEEITPVGQRNPYIVKHLYFTPTTPDGTLKFEHTTPAGDHTLLLDNVRIVKGHILEAPRLAAGASSGSIRIAWPVSFTGFRLESTSTLPGGWAAVATAPTVEANENVVLEASGSGRKFYRLVSP